MKIFTLIVFLIFLSNVVASGQQVPEKLKFENRFQTIYLEAGVYKFLVKK